MKARVAIKILQYTLCNLDFLFLGKSVHIRKVFPASRETMQGLTGRSMGSIPLSLQIQCILPSMRQLYYDI